MKDENKDLDTIAKKLDQVIVLQKYFIAIQLYSMGVSQDQITKNLGIAKVSINKILKGVTKKEKTK